MRTCQPAPDARFGDEVGIEPHVTCCFGFGLLGRPTERFTAKIGMIQAGVACVKMERL